MTERKLIRQSDYFLNSNVRSLRARLRERNLQCGSAEEYPPINLELLRQPFRRYPHEVREAPPKPPVTPPSEAIKTAVDFDLFFSSLIQTLDETLPSTKRSILNWVEEGKSNSEIAALLNISEGRARDKVWELRSKIEEEYLTPNGIRILSEFRELHKPKALKNAVRDNRLTGKMFLRMYYSHRALVEKYKFHLYDTIPPALQATGLKIASDHLTLSECDLLATNPAYRDLYTIVNGVMCMFDSGIIQFRRLTSPPSINHKQLTEFAPPNTRAYNRIRKAVERGDIPTVKVKDILHVLGEDIEAYYAGHPRAARARLLEESVEVDLAPKNAPKSIKPAASSTEH